MNRWVSFYEQVMGFKNILTFDDKDISTEYSALMSKVMSNGNGQVKFPINEPAEGKKKSQVEEFLDYFNGEGVQHVAMATKDIVHTVSELMRRGIEFLKVPSAYYDDLRRAAVGNEVEAAWLWGQLRLKAAQLAKTNPDWQDNGRRTTCAP